MPNSADEQSSVWGTDGPISMPIPRAADSGDLVPFGGFAFSPAGLVHELTEVDREEIYSDAYAPPGGVDG